MKKAEFLEFYEMVVKTLGLRFAEEFENFRFIDSPDSLYEEYLNQKILLRMLYEKDRDNPGSLMDRHKVCACMTVAIIKIRLLNCKTEDTDDYSLASATRANEQLAFMSCWELFKGFVSLHKADCQSSFDLPETYHNLSFLDTITRSLFFANQMNGLSVPLIANIFFLLEKYCETFHEQTSEQRTMKDAVLSE